MMPVPHESCHERHHGKIQFIACVGLYGLNALLIAAHFLRAGQFVLAALCLLAPSLFFYHYRLGLRLLQLLAGGAALVWILTAARLVMVRIALGHPWKTAVAILASGAVLNIIAALCLNLGAVQQRYPRTPTVS